MSTNSTTTFINSPVPTLAPYPTRTRPKLGHLLYGAAFLWGGSSAVVAGVTTLGPSASMALGLVVVGMGTIATVASGRRFANPTTTSTTTSAPFPSETVPNETVPNEAVMTEAGAETHEDIVEDDDSEFSWESPYTD